MQRMPSFFRRRAAPKLGQHLLTSGDVARQVAVAADAQKGDTVLEIGPGTGMLTRELLLKGVRVVAVEKDPEMLAALRGMFPREIETGTLALVEGDARELLSPFSFSLVTYKVVANIPYYITGELLRLFLTARPQPEAVALLVQREVAERIVRSKKESLLSLSVKAYGMPRYVRTVKAGSFNPPPKVDSAILSISDISRRHFSSVSEDSFFGLIRIGFGQKRKTLKGNLKRSGRFESAAVERGFVKTGLADDVRAEDVPLETWFSLAESLQSREAA